MDADSPKTNPRRFRALTAALIFFAMLAAAYLLAPQTIGEQARRSIQRILQDHYPGLYVTIGSGRIDSRVGLILEDLEFASPVYGQQKGRRFLHVDRLIIETNVTIDKIFDAKVPVCASRIMAVGVEADIWQEQNATWSIAKLFPPPTMGPGCPRIEVYDARLRLYRDGIKNPDIPERPVEFDQLRMAINVIASPNSSEKIHEFSVSARSDFINLLQFEGTASSHSMTVRGSVNGLRIDPVLTSRLPLMSEKTQSQLTGLTAQGDLTFAVEKPASGNANFLAKWACHQGRYQHASLPQSIEDVRGMATMTPAGITVESAQCKLGESLCVVSGATSGYRIDSDVTARIVATNLLINDRISSSLPVSAQIALDKIRPRGNLNLDSRVSRKNGIWKADAVVDLHGIDLNVDKFPYPVSQVIGKVHLRDSQAWSEQLSGRVGAQRINIAFLKSNRGSGQPSWIRLAMDGPVPIDSTLLNSLTARGEPQSKLEKFVRSLSPRGNVHLASGRWETSPTGEKSQVLDLRISGGSMRYSGFPYALYDVAGQAVSRNDTVDLLGFTAKNGDNAAITCEGTFDNLTRVIPRPSEGDWRVGLHFTAKDLPLDETIRAALPTSSQRTWDSLAPTGVLDTLDVRVTHAANFDSPKLLIGARQEAKRTIDRRTVSLRPTMLPYRLDIMEGAVRYDGNDVIIESLDARHDATRVAADGRCAKTENGQWRMDMNVRSGSRLHPDTELVNSLPNQVRGAFQRLQLRGPLSIRGTTSLLLPDAANPDPIIDWGLTIQLEGNRIGDVGPVHDLRGEIMVQGKRDGVGVTADGIVSIDSMHVDDKQVTSIHGPFAIRDDRLLLGETIALAGEQSTATPLPAMQTSKTISPIEGKLFDGVASLSGDVLLSNGNFDVTMAIRDADVATLLADLGETNSTVVGNIDGRVRLEGTVGLTHLLKGTGSGKLSGANLYQVPVLIQVFNMVRVTPSEKVAFTDGEVRFAIYGDSVTFNQIQLWGDLIALHGNGSMNRTKDVDLSFNTRVSPQNGWSQVLRPFGDNQYTLFTINVKGPLSDPAIERRTLTAMNDTLERMFPGMAAPKKTPGPISSRIDDVRDKLKQ